MKSRESFKVSLQWQVSSSCCLSTRVLASALFPSPSVPHPWVLSSTYTAFLFTAIPMTPRSTRLFHLMTPLSHHAFHKTGLLNFKQNHVGCACSSATCSYIITAVCLFQTHTLPWRTRGVMFTVMSERVVRRPSWDRAYVCPHFLVITNYY